MINLSEELTGLSRRGWKRDLGLILQESHLVKESWVDYLHANLRPSYINQEEWSVLETLAETL